MLKKANVIHPIYFFYGVEDYLIQDEVKRLIDQVLPPAERGLNLHVFSGEEHGTQEILQTAQTLPMFSKYRFVLVNKADQLDEKEIEGFLNYIQKPLSIDLPCFMRSGQRSLEKESGPDREDRKGDRMPPIERKGIDLLDQREDGRKGKGPGRGCSNLPG